MFLYDIEAVHALAAIVGTWLLLVLAPRSLVGAAVFVFNMGYLLAAYYHFSSAESYDIDFTMVHCVLTLRLIGLGFDYSDGALPDTGALSAYARANRLVARPALAEVLGFAYHWAGLVVGPQYSLATYRLFLDGRERAAAPSSVLPALQTFLLGAAYLGINVVGGQFVPTAAVLADGFLAHPLWWRVGYVWVAFRVLLTRYAGMWLLADGHCILSGLGYNGVDKGTGRHRWDRVSNFIPASMITATTIGDYVGAFNVNTNAWVKEYIFKRLRFLNNRHLSSAGSLVFLAVWHGFAPGYFFTFALEFFDSLAEAALWRIVGPALAFARAQSKPLLWFLRAAGYVLASLMLSFGLLAFDVKTLDKSLEAYNRLAWICYTVPAGILAVDLVLSVLRPTKSKKTA